MRRDFSAAYVSLLLAGGIALFFGLMAETFLLYSFLRVGFGTGSIIVGGLLLLLSLRVRESSQWALGIAVLVYACDIVLQFAQFLFPEEINPPITILVLKVFLLANMLRGFLPAPDFSAAENRDSLTITHPMKNPGANLPTLIPPPVSIVYPGRLQLIHNPITSETTRRIRFQIFRFEFDEYCFAATFPQGETFRGRWREVEMLFIKLLPPEQPFCRRLILDLFMQGAKSPIRILSSTFVSYKDLPYGPSPTSRENIRRLGFFILSHAPQTTTDEATLSFIYSATRLSGFSNIANFIEYEESILGARRSV